MSPEQPRAPSLSPTPPFTTVADARMPEVVPSTSRIAGKVRGLVARHPDETLSVLRRWLEEKNRGV